MKNKKLLSVALLVLGLMLFAFGCSKTNKDVSAANKNIVITVVDTRNNSSEEIKKETTKETLGDALVEANIVTVKESNMGRFLTGVKDINADESKQEWWKVTVNGEDAQKGIDDIKLNDGDKITLTLNVGY